MEQEIKNSIGMGGVELQPDPSPHPEPTPPPVTIYDFAKVLSENEPSKKEK